MPFEPVETFKDVMTTNQWLLEIDGQRIGSFSSINGLNRSMGTLQRGDGGTGLVYKFINQQLTFGQLTLTRQRDPSDPIDAQIKKFMDDSIASGKKYSGQFIKYHHGKPAFRIVFYGLMFFSEGHPGADKAASGIYNMSYQATVDFWEELPAAA